MVNYTATDPLGSPRVLTSELGEIVSRRDFMPFGEDVAADQTYRTATHKYGVGDGVRQKFTGYERDNEISLDFAQARYYGYSHGRFTSPDIVAGERINPQTLNRYVYVANNPLNYVDPSGYCGTTAGSPDKTPCLWYRNAEGNYMSVSQQQFGDGSNYAGYSLVEDREAVYFQLTNLNGDYANDAEYQALVKNNSFVGLGANGRFVGLPGDPVAIGAEEDVPDGTTQVAPGSGYFDFNLTGGHYGFVATGGVQVDSNLNLFPYVGGGVGTPGIGWSFGYSPDTVTPGPNAQIQVTPLGTIGIDRKKNSFTEFNVGPPGASATVTWVFGKDDGTVPPRFPTGPNAKVNSPLDYRRPSAPNCSCNVSVPR